MSGVVVQSANDSLGNYLAGAVYCTGVADEQGVLHDFVGGL